MQKSQLLIITVLFILFCGCKKDRDPVFNTDHPDGARVTFTTDWSNRGSGVDIPGSYTVSATGMEPEVATAGSSYTVTHLFAPGSYEFLLYSDVTEIAVTDGTATVKTVASVESATGTFIEPLPGWLFTGKTKADLKADRKYELPVTMEQQVRQLTLVLDPEGSAAGDIRSIEGYLTGVAGELDIRKDSYSAPSNVLLAFTQITAGDDAGKWMAAVRLLGIAGEEQQVVVTLSLAGEEEGVPLEITLADQLSGFNGNKKEPLTVTSRFTVDTPDPGPGPEPNGKTEVTLFTDWSDRGAGIEPPAVYTVITTDVLEEATGERYVLESVFDPGTYPFYLYNEVPGIEVTDGVARVIPAGSVTGWLFTGYKEVTIDAVPQYDLSVTMHQQVRRLTLVLEIEGDAAQYVTAIEGSLSGVAGQLNIRDHTHSDPSDVTLRFTRLTRGGDAGKWEATVYLLGIAGDAPGLTATVFLAGDREDVLLKSSLEKELSVFNNDKKTPVELTGSLTINTTPDPGPAPEPGTSAGFTAIIKKWQQVTGGEGIAT